MSGVEYRMREPEAIIQAQLDAYNDRDIDAFMAHWAEDAQVYAFPATLLATGAAAIRARHIERFKEPDLTATLLSRTSVENLVIDRETVTRTFPEGRGQVEVIAIYEVEDGKIARAWFRMGGVVLG